MKKLLLVLLFVSFAVSTSAQVTKQLESFKTIQVINNKIYFVKEVDLKENPSQKNYEILKKWAIDNYGRDPFISSVRFDDKKYEVSAKSSIELILPENSDGIREKVIMKYKLNAFLINDKAVLEISDISYIYNNPKEKKLSRRVTKAEDMITDPQIALNDNLKELRINTKKSTLYFLNTLGKDFESLYGFN